MFGIETNQQQINKLEKQLATVRKVVEGGLFDEGLQDRVRLNKEHIAGLESNMSRLSKRITVLEEIVRESGLITDFDNDEVKIREDRKYGIFGGIDVKQTPYQINKIKVK
jgi:hypothetical protein